MAELNLRLKRKITYSLLEISPHETDSQREKFGGKYKLFIQKIIQLNLDSGGSTLASRLSFRDSLSLLGVGIDLIHRATCFQIPQLRMHLASIKPQGEIDQELLPTL